MRTVTIATMLSCGGGIPTTFAVYHATLHGRKRRTAYIDVGMGVRVGVEQIAEHAPHPSSDQYYEWAQKYATADAPAFRWEQLPE